jgi:acetoin utilization deacetylase AcuC-like enzyme
MQVALIYEERCLAHDNGSMVIDERARGWLDVPHFESAARIARTYSTLAAAGVLDRVEHVAARKASEDDLMLVHTRSHIQKIKDACASPTPVTVGPEARAGWGRGSQRCSQLAARSPPSTGCSPPRAGADMRCSGRLATTPQPTWR